MSSSFHAQISSRSPLRLISRTRQKQIYLLGKPAVSQVSHKNIFNLLIIWCIGTHNYFRTAGKRYSLHDVFPGGQSLSQKPTVTSPHSVVTALDLVSTLQKHRLELEGKSFKNRTHLVSRDLWLSWLVSASSDIDSQIPWPLSPGLIQIWVITARRFLIFINVSYPTDKCTLIKPASSRSRPESSKFSGVPLWRPAPLPWYWRYQFEDLEAFHWNSQAQDQGK